MHRRSIDLRHSQFDRLEFNKLLRRDESSYRSHIGGHQANRFDLRIFQRERSRDWGRDLGHLWMAAMAFGALLSDCVDVFIRVRH